ncbi:MAG: hypothetical protein JEY99_11900 [Spirochaetales bacterium]|nr:hypothetical protein [Spirochaetales bacterium]
MRRIIFLFKAAAVGSFLLLFSACMTVMYGVPFKYKNGSVTVTNGNGIPIHGLSVMVSDPAMLDDPFTHVMTDMDGRADFIIELDYLSDLQIDIEDIDGPQNLGEFQPETIFIDTGVYEDNESIDIDISLEEE